MQLFAVIKITHSIFTSFRTLFMSLPLTRYTKTAIVLHGLIALGIFAMFALGWYMHEIPKDAAKQISFDLFDLGIYSWQLTEAVSPRAFYFNLHKSIGVTLLVLILFRVYWRITHRPPAMLRTYKAWERKLATATHHLLYVLMVAMPLSGLIMATTSKYGVIWFGIEIIPGLDNKFIRELFKETHEVIGAVLLAFIILHTLGALKHKLIDKDETMKRMSFK